MSRRRLLLGVLVGLLVWSGLSAPGVTRGTDTYAGATSGGACVHAFTTATVTASGTAFDVKVLGIRVDVTDGASGKNLVRVCIVVMASSVCQEHLGMLEEIQALSTHHS